MADSDRRSTLLDTCQNIAVIVSGIVADELGHPTPCPKYDVAGLIDHLVKRATGRPLSAAGRHHRPETSLLTWSCPTRPVTVSYAAPRRRRHKHGATIPACR
jgi:hypothetical protein